MHPGGAGVILKQAGKDATYVFPSTLISPEVSINFYMWLIDKWTWHVARSMRRYILLGR